MFSFWVIFFSALGLPKGAFGDDFYGFLVGFLSKSKFFGVKTGTQPSHLAVLFFLKPFWGKTSFAQLD